MGHLPKKGTRLTAQQRPLTDRPAPSIRRRRMVALLVLGLLLWAATAQAQPQDVTHPGPVTNIALTSGYQSITVTWGPPDDNGGSPIVEYVLECRGDFDGVTWNGTTVGGNIHSHKFTQCNLPLQNGTTYDFRMYARNKWRSGSQTDLTIHSTVAGLPAAPTGLTATAGDRQVALSWTAGSNNGSALTAYQYRQNGGSWADIQNSDATTTSHTVTGLTNGTAYTFKVRAVNTHGDGVESAAATATPVGPPEKPTLTATDGDRQVTLNWTGPSDTGGSAITGWKYSKDNGTIWDTIANSNATTTSHTVTGLTNGTAYTFKVRAVNTHGDGAESDAVTATPATTPAAPTGLSATDNNQASGAVRLSWTAGGNGGSAITGYQYSTDNGSSWAATGATTTSHTVTGLTNGTAYTFKVRAVNRKGDGTASAAVTATPATTPAAPTGLSATDNNQASGAVRLSWTAGGNGGSAITGYQYSTDNGSSWTATGATTTSYTVTGLTNGTTYTFKVRAVNRKGDGTASAAVTATPATTPAAPTALTVVTGNQQVRLSWTAPTNTGGANITGYEYSQDNGSSWSATNATTTSYTVTGLTNGTTYTFQVRAVNKKGNGAESAAKTATPRNFTATAGNQAVTLNWSALPANANIVKWQYQQTNGTWADIPSSTTSTTHYTVTGLDNGTPYTFQIRGLDGSNNTVEQIEFPAATPQQPAPQDQTGFGGSSGGDDTADQHGDTPATATSVAVDSSTPGQMNSSTDQDYFTIAVPQAGLLVVETSGSVDTLGVLTTPDGQMLAQADSGGVRQNFQLTQRVTAGDYLVAVSGTGTGSYRLEVDLLVGFVDNPQPDSAQSGIGVLSGWVCEAETVEFELNGALQEAAYGTERTDTQLYCEDTNNGFGLLWNWNLLGAGPHTVRVVVDGIEFATLPITVTTLGLDDEFPTGLTGEATLEDFPTAGESVRLVWQEAQQNFALAEGPTTPRGSTRDPNWAFLENPAPGSYQSGIRVISGWACEAEEVVLEIDGKHRLVAAYGTERTDTEDKCGDTDNGFGLLWNWNLFGAGPHTIRLLVDREEWATAAFTVTTLGAEMRWGLAYTGTVADFPTPGQAVTVEWQEAQQNFVITGVE